MPYNYTITMPTAGEFEETLSFYSGFEDKDYAFTCKYKLVSGKINRVTDTIAQQINNTMVGIDPKMLSEFEKKFTEKQITALCGLLFCI